jgi:hypothetical protein
MAEDARLRGHVMAGPYRLVRRLADGTPALYEARHPRVAGPFAARLWAPTVPWDAFRRGAEIAMTLRHPGVVQVIDFNCEPGAPPFLITEWLEGTPLSQLMASSGLLPLPRVAALVESAAWALASAHQQGVVHQELAPAQVLVVEAAGTTREWTKLDGFGMAAALARAGAAPPSPYRAPEQAAPDDDGADPQSDQHALAAIAYEMLTGVRPFDDAAEPGTRRGEPPSIIDLVPGVSQSVDTVIRQGLAADPEQRFAGILEFARALRDASQGGSTQLIRRRKVEARAASRARGSQEVPVSPFFNPVQAPPGEGSLHVPAGRAARAPLGSARAFLKEVVPTGTPARILIALTVLVGMFGVLAAAVGFRRPPRQAAAVTPARPASGPVVTTLTAPPPAAGPAPSPSPAAEPQPAIAVAEVRLPPAPAPARPEPARHPHGGAHRPHVAAPPATATAAATAGAGGCSISVSSKPAADVWLDDHKLGRRTPLAGYAVGCGDHKLVLKRDDLDLYQMEVITVRAGAPFRKSYPLQ